VRDGSIPFSSTNTVASRCTWNLRLRAATQIVTG